MISLLLPFDLIALIQIAGCPVAGRLGRVAPAPDDGCKCVDIRDVMIGLTRPTDLTVYSRPISGCGSAVGKPPWYLGKN